MSVPLESAVLAEVAVGLFEESAFLFVEVGQQAEPRGELLRTRIAWTLPRPGWLSLTASKPLATEIAASMLGLAPGEAGTEDARQALSELANVLAGALLARLFGTGAPAAIGLPRVEDAAAPEAGGVRAALRVEGGEVIGLCADLEPERAEP